MGTLLRGTDSWPGPAALWAGRPLGWLASRGPLGWGAAERLHPWWGGLPETGCHHVSVHTHPGR